MSSPNKQIQFHYKKSNLFRVIHSDGAWGGLTPELDVFFTFFNSRPPIPEMLVQKIDDDGKLGDEIPELGISKKGIVREVEVGVVMKSEDVQNLIIFLQDRLANIKKIKESNEEKEMPKERKDK